MVGTDYGSFFVTGLQAIVLFIWSFLFFLPDDIKKDMIQKSRGNAIESFVEKTIKSMQLVGETILNHIGNKDVLTASGISLAISLVGALVIWQLYLKRNARRRLKRISEG